MHDAVKHCVHVAVIASCCLCLLAYWFHRCSISRHVRLDDNLLLATWASLPCCKTVLLILLHVLLVICMPATLRDSHVAAKLVSLEMVMTAIQEGCINTSRIESLSCMPTRSDDHHNTSCFDRVGRRCLMQHHCYMISQPYVLQPRPHRESNRNVYKSVGNSPDSSASSLCLY